MFCQKCGQQNPENGKFCRSCGTDLGNVTQALADTKPTQPLDRKGRPINWEGAIMPMFGGLAFIIVALSLFFTGRGSGWWFWMLIPGFMMLGSGVAKYVQIKNDRKSQIANAPAATMTIESGHQASLPPQQRHFVSSESRYKTGDLVPPSVTDSTTRHLELDSESKTMTLPKK